MEVREMFRILQIEETKDKNTIRSAYRRLLPQTNPEDDPEGFKRLRQAYEEALRFGDRQEPETVDRQRDESPLGIWLEQAEQIYGQLSRRVDEKEWQALLQEEICQALDMSVEVQERFLVFLLSHYRLPVKVWRLIDREFRIVEQKQQLLEKFPRDFLNFICFEIENGGFLDYSLFEGPDDGEYDGYIALYLQLKRVVDGCMAAPPEQVEIMEKEAEDLFGRLEAMEVYHPYTEAERLRLAIKGERETEVRERLELLLWQSESNSYLLLQCGAACEYIKEFEQAGEIYKGLLERQSDNYPAGVGMLHCEMAVNQWTAAKERVMDLMEIAKNDPHLLDCMRRINRQLIPDKEAVLAADPQNWQERIELGWCYFQEERSDDVLTLMREQPLPEEQRIEYCNMVSRTYMMRAEYEASLPLLQEWRERMEQLPDNEEPEIKKRRRRLGYACYAKAYCLQELGREEEALICYAEAVELEKEEEMLQSYMMGHAQLLCRMKRYAESVDVCDRLLERNENYVPAYICRQECNYRLHRPQDVVDDYHRAVAIYPFFLSSYLMAAKVFFQYQQFKNALDVIMAARQYEMSDTELDYLEARTLRYLAEKKEDLERPKQLLRNVLEALDKESEEQDPSLLKESYFEQTEKGPVPGADPVETESVWKELAFCYMDEKDWEEARRIITCGLQLFPEDEGLCYAKAGTLKGLEQYQEAEELYRRLLKGQPDNVMLMNHLADCMEKNGDREGLEDLCQKVLERDPENVRAMHRLMHIYQDRMNERKDVGWLRPALDLADRMVQLQPTAYYYIERGLLLSDVYELEAALEDYTHAMELEPDNLYARNNAGVNHQRLGLYQKAEEFYRQAISLLEEDNKSILPWKNLSVLYLILGRWEDALACVAENEKLFPGRASFYMDRAEILHRMGRPEESIAEYQRFLREKDPGSRRAKVNIADTYAMHGHIREAERRFKKLWKEHPEDRWIEDNYLDFLMESARDHRTAYGILKKRLSTVRRDTLKELHSLGRLVECCYHLKKWEERDRYYMRALKILEDQPEGAESYVEMKPEAPSRLYHLGRLCLYGGDISLAEEFFQRMLQSCRCEFCHYGGCYEGCLGMALVRMRQERWEEAEKYLRRCMEINPYNQEGRYYLNNRRKW